MLKICLGPGPQNFMGNVASPVDDEGGRDNLHITVILAYLVIAYQYGIVQTELFHPLEEGG